MKKNLNGGKQDYLSFYIHHVASLYIISVNSKAFIFYEVIHRARSLPFI